MTEVNNGQKWIISLWAAIVFFILAAPFTYKFTGMLCNALNLEIENDGCPNLLGLAIHTVLFLIIVRIMMITHLPGT